MKLHAQHRLPVFITLSLAVHLVWFTGQCSWTLHPPQQDSRQMSVHINETSQPEHSSKNPSRASTSVQHSQPALKEPTRNGSAASSPTVRQDPPQDLNQLARARIIGKVQQRLVQYFVYPTLARRQGWQGQVTLGFKVDETGSIRHIHIKHSSGYAILDDSAVNAMQQVGQVQLDEFGFMDRFWQLEIPIIYRLEG